MSTSGATSRADEIHDKKADERTKSFNAKTGNIECALWQRVNLTESIDKNKSLSHSAPENL